jgi:hypothetical protein
MATLIFRDKAAAEHTHRSTFFFSKQGSNIYAFCFVEGEKEKEGKMSCGCPFVRILKQISSGTCASRDAVLMDT